MEALVAWLLGGTPLAGAWASAVRLLCGATAPSPGGRTQDISRLCSSPAAGAAPMGLCHRSRPPAFSLSGKHAQGQGQ